MIPNVPNIYRVTPNADEEAPPVHGQPRRESHHRPAADSFDNNISSAGLPAYIIMGNVYGSTGSIRYRSGVAWIDIGVSTLVYTDANGQVGVSTGIGYQISSRSGDYASVWMGTTTVPHNKAAYDAYDAAAWSAPGPLSDISVAWKSLPLPFPDFTRGNWQEPDCRAQR